MAQVEARNGLQTSRGDAHFVAQAAARASSATLHPLAVNWTGVASSHGLAHRTNGDRLHDRGAATLRAAEPLAPSEQRSWSIAARRTKRDPAQRGQQGALRAHIARHETSELADQAAAHKAGQICFGQVLATHHLFHWLNPPKGVYPVSALRWACGSSKGPKETRSFGRVQEPSHSRDFSTSPCSVCPQDAHDT